MPNKTPDTVGRWKDPENGDVIDIYDLEPCDVLCAWAGDLTSGGWCLLDTSNYWSTDEWLGHIPASCLESHFGDWIKIE